MWALPSPCLACGSVRGVLGADAFWFPFNPGFPIWQLVVQAQPVVLHEEDQHGYIQRYIPFRCAALHFTLDR